MFARTRLRGQRRLQAALVERVRHEAKAIQRSQADFSGVIGPRVLDRNLSRRSGPLTASAVPRESGKRGKAVAEGPRRRSSPFNGPRDIAISGAEPAACQTFQPVLNPNSRFTLNGVQHSSPNCAQTSGRNSSILPFLARGRYLVRHNATIASGKTISDQKWIAP